MSVYALYRVMVRMLYDAEFTRAVYADRVAALAGVDVHPEERDWLVAPDPRAWRTDGMRRMRSLTGLLEEFPVAAAFVLRRGREGVVRLESALLDAFFSHPILHQCLQEGGSMVFAFSRYLEEPVHAGVAADPRIAPLARLEAAIARMRRVRDPGTARRTTGGTTGSTAGTTGASRAPNPPDMSRRGETSPTDLHLRMAPWAELIVLPAGTSELHARVSKALRARDRQPVAAVLDRQWSLPVLLDLDFAVEEPVLVERPPEPDVAWAGASVRQAPITRELAGLLRAARPGATRGELIAAARALGADPGDDAEIVDGLVREGLLVPVGRPCDTS